jgi:hypothetical protein
LERQRYIRDTKLTQAQFIYEHFIYDVGASGGTALSETQGRIDAFDTQYDSMSLLVPCTAGGVGKLFFPDLRSQVHYAFEKRVIAEGGSVANSRYNVIVNDFPDASLMNPCSAGKAGVLYSAIPNATQANAIVVNVNAFTPSGTSRYRIPDAPELNVVRSYIDPETIVSVVNMPSAFSARLYIAEGHSATFSAYPTALTGSNVVIVETPNITTDYKFKASYFINGFITSNVQYEGVRSAPNYTLGVK